MFADTETQKPKRPLPGRYQRHTSVCIRCWRHRAQKAHWCCECWNDMHRLAHANGDDPHTCQAPDCTALVQPGEALCPACEQFFTGQVDYGS